LFLALILFSEQVFTPSLRSVTPCRLSA